VKEEAMRMIKPWSNNRFLALSLILFISGMATTGWAATCTSNSGARSWNTAASWDCGHVPATGDAVVIAAGSTVTLNVDSNTIASLTVNNTGTLTVASGTSFDIYLGGSLTNNGTINFAASGSTNTIYLAGTNVTSTWSGTGTWNLDNADLNGKNPKSCSGSCDIELIGSPLLHFANQTLFSGLGTSFTFNAAGNSTATVDLDFAGSQTIATTNVKFPNLTLTGTGAKTPASGTLTVLGNMTIGNGITVNADSNDPTINIGGSLSIGSGATYTASNNGVTTITGSFSNSGTYTGNSAAVNVGGNFSNTSAFTSGSGTWTFNGTSAVQNFTTAATFQRLTLNNSLGFSLGNNVTVSTLLTLSAGPVVTGAYSLLATANCPGSISRTSGYVAGNLRLTVPNTNPVTCIFPVGDANNYAPISITKTGTNSGTLTGATTVGDHADTTAGTSGIDATRSVNRTWTLTAGTLSGSTPYSAIFQFCDAVGSGCGVNDVDAGASFGSFLVAEKVAAWSLPTVANPTASSIQATGLTSFGVFAVGEAVLPTALAEYRMDEASWNGTANEVVDSSGNGNHAQAFNSANTTDGSRAIVGSPGTCRYGVFDNGGAITQGYVQTPLPNLTSNFTITAWIRTTNNTVAGQRILIDDQNNTGGYGLSMSDGTAGLLRFYSRGITPTILDSTYTIANNTWYFVAAVADITNKKRTIYVFNQTGVQLSSTTESAWTAGTWGTDAGPVSIGGEVNGPPQTELPASSHFRGNIDEVRVYQKALNSSDLTTLAKATHTCASAGPDHLQIEHSTGSGLTCAASSLTIRACADAAPACTAYTGGVSGTLTKTGTPTVNWDGTTGGATGANFVITSGSSSVTKNMQLTTAGSVVFGISSPVPTPPNVTTCNFGSPSCTFNASSAGGFVVSVPNHRSCVPQVATITVPAGCGTALDGSKSVGFHFAYSLATTTSPPHVPWAGLATPGAALATGADLPLNLTFTSGSAQLPYLIYDDAGSLTLTANYAGSGLDAGLSMTGTSSPFVVAPNAFRIDPIPSPLVAGTAFNATVTALNACSTPAATPNFTDSVSLTYSNPIPALGNENVLPTRLLPISGFSGGIKSTSLTWKEVGTIDLNASLANYLSASPAMAVSGTLSGVGPFKPAYFDTAVTAGTGTFTYSGQPFTVTVTAKNALGGTTANYAGIYAKLVTLSDANAGTNSSGTLGSFANASIPAASFTTPAAGVASTSTIAYTFTSRTTPPLTLAMRAVDADSVSSSGHTEATNEIRSGLVRMANAYGSERLVLPVTTQVEYYSATGWTLNAADTGITATALSAAPTVTPVGGIVTAANCPPPTACTTSSKFTGGILDLRMTAPNAAGYADITLNVPAWLQYPWHSATAENPTSRVTFGIYKGNNRIIYRREQY
jgi:MSHA biogenesis protein MshQ